MLEWLLNDATNLQFVLALIILVTGVMILLQATLRRAVWSWYLIGFFGSVVALAVTLR